MFRLQLHLQKPAQRQEILSPCHLGLPSPRESLNYKAKPRISEVTFKNHTKNQSHTAESQNWMTTVN